MEQILIDPSSHLTAALLGWDHPASREWVIAADIYDLTVQINTPKGRKAKPYPRPWKSQGKRVGKTSLPPEEAKRALARMAGR